MSQCSKKCNELKNKIDGISGLNDKYVYNMLCQIEDIIGKIDAYADTDEFNGTCFSKSGPASLDLYVKENKDEN